MRLSEKGNAFSFNAFHARRVFADSRTDTPKVHGRLLLSRFCSEEFSKVRRRKQEISGFLPRPQHGTLNRFVDPSDTLDVKRNRGGNESS